jgi:signal transduction histidine kinase
VAAALSACTFVKAEISEKEPMRTEKSIQSVREDFHIIDSSLRFINDLLRNMLGKKRSLECPDGYQFLVFVSQQLLILSTSDMHRAASKKLNVELVPMDIRQDILDPVGAMLYQRDLGFEVIIECPQNLVVMTDRLRLKQIMLNLGRNSAKFVERGFVRLGAEVIDNEVIVFVEDSGPGINEEKQQNLFSKFQESLDVLGKYQRSDLSYRYVLSFMKESFSSVAQIKELV